MRRRPPRSPRTDTRCAYTTRFRSMLTGEPLPVAKSAGADGIGATMNGTGSLVIRAEKGGSATVLSQIVQLVAQAQRSRAPMQRMADKVSFWFVQIGREPD